MKFSFAYDKKKVLQGLRYHFISRNEIRLLIILVNVFAIISAVLLYMKKINPEPFLLSSVIWLLLMITFWFVLPNTIYKKAATFKESFTIFFYDNYVRLESPRSHTDWTWNQFTNYFESPNFFHLYFSSKAFFLLPKEDMSSDFAHELRNLLKLKIKPSIPKKESRKR